jgi:hypothetical protein
MLVIKDKFHKDEKSLLLPQQGYHIPTVEHDFFRKLKENGVFDEIISCRGQPTDHNRDYDEQVTEYYDSFFEKQNICLDDFSDIYLGFDTFNPLGAYLDIRGIRHSVIIGTCAEWIYNLSETLGGYPHKYVDWTRRHCILQGEGQYTQKRFADKRVEIEKPLEKDVILDFRDLWFNLSDELRRKISSILPQEELKKLSDGESYFVLPNSIGYMTPRTRLLANRRCYVYQLALDFYCNAGENARIYYKEHPQVNLSDGDKYFKNCTVLPPIIPVEFFALIDGFSVNNLIAVTSTSGKWLSPFVKNFYSPAEIFFNTFREIYRHFAAFAIDELISDEKTAYHICGINKPFIEDFTANVLRRKIEYKDINQTILDGNIFTLLDDVNVKSLVYGLTSASNGAKCVIYYTDMFYLPKYISLRQYVVPIVIKKCVIDESCIADIDDEYICFFSKDATVRDKVRKLNKIRVLPHTRMALNIKAVSDTFWR